MNGQRPPPIYEFGDFQLDVTQRLLRSKDGRPVALTARVFETLLYLVEHAGQLVDKSALMQAVWPHVVVEEGSLSQAVYELRRALGERPDERRFIVTVPGRGYQFIADVVARERPSAAIGPSQPADFAASTTTSPPTELPPQNRSLEIPPGDDPSPRLGAKRPSPLPRLSVRYLVPAMVLLAGAFALWKGAGTHAVDPPRAERPGGADATVATVAVLPFVDLSYERDQQYLTEGLSEELIHLLAQSPSLRVLARTSSFSFKNRDADVATIAGKLGATHILEGSVRKGGERLRIAVQLIDGATGTHIWSQTYDRSLDDALAIERDIASSIAAALNATLAGNGSARDAASDPRAYGEFLLAQFFFNRRQNGDLGRAEQAYRRAIALQPAFARAWAGLAGVYYLASDREDLLGLTRDEALTRLRDAADRALALDPKLADAYMRRANYRFLIGDRGGAAEDLRHAAALEPNNPLVVAGLAHDALVEGRPNDAVELQRRIVQRDPLSVMPRSNLGALLYFAGRFDEAAIESRTALELATAQDQPWDASITLAKTLIAQGRFDDALALVQAWPKGQYRDHCLAIAYYALGNGTEADAALEQLVASEPSEPHWVAEAYAHRGDIDRAFQWVGRAAARSRDDGDASQLWRMDIRYSPFATSLHRDPRWKAEFTEWTGG